jgi:thiol:disulfide interchange protein
MFPETGSIPFRPAEVGGFFGTGGRKIEKIWTSASLYRVMKRILTTIAVFAATAAFAAAGLEGWMDNLDKALEKAKKENKPLLVEFTGSDWCPPCKMMRRNVFSKKAFVEAASKKWILVEVDSPRGKPEVARKNQPLFQKYKITGVPTVILMDKNGKEFNRFFASEHPSIEDFLKNLDKQLERKNLD